MGRANFALATSVVRYSRKHGLKETYVWASCTSLLNKYDFYMIHFKMLLSKYNIMVKCIEIHIQANFHINLFVGMNWPLNPLTWPWMVDRPFSKMPSGWPPPLPDSEGAVVFIFTSKAWIYNMVKQKIFIRYKSFYYGSKPPTSPCTFPKRCIWACTTSNMWDVISFRSLMRWIFIANNDLSP